jgi:hypothetical protein
MFFVFTSEALGEAALAGAVLVQSEAFALRKCARQLARKVPGQGTKILSADALWQSGMPDNLFFCENSSLVHVLSSADVNPAWALPTAAVYLPHSRVEEST